MNNYLTVIEQVGNESARLRKLGYFPTWFTWPKIQSIVLRLEDGNGYQLERVISVQCAASAKFNLIQAECEIAIRELQSINGEGDE